MKKTLKTLALVLAVLMMISVAAACGDEKEDAAATTAVTTVADKVTIPAETTTSGLGTAPVGDDEPDPGDDIKTETPAVGEEADKFAETYNKITVLTDTIQTEGYATWNAETQGADRLFDGTENKMGGNVENGALKITVQIEPAKIAAYVLVTGEDSSVWTGRTPTAWVLRGSKDGTTWTDIDVVEDSAMEDIDNQSYGFTVDSDKVAEYSYIQFEFTEGTNITQGFVQFQLIECILYAPK